MARDKPWLKMWVEWLGDVKMDRLSLAEQGCWWRLLSLAHECGHLDGTGKPDGALIVAGTPLTLVEIMKTLKITDDDDKESFNRMLEKMKNAGSLHWNSDTLYVTHYEERQRAITDTKEERRRRQHERREAIKAKEKKREAEKNPSPQETYEEVRVKSTEVRDSRLDLSRKNRDAALVAEIIRLVDETKKEPINEVLRDRINQFIEWYVGPVEWIEKAFKQAPLHKRRWAYVDKILQGWQEEGGPDDRGKREPRGMEQGRAGAHRGYPGAGAAERRESGWEDVGDE